MAVKQVRTKRGIPESCPQRVAHWLWLLTTASGVIKFGALFAQFSKYYRSSLKSKSKIFLRSVKVDLPSKPFRRWTGNASILALLTVALEPVQNLSQVGGLSSWN
jgi:hypothetical protein